METVLISVKLFWEDLTPDQDNDSYLFKVSGDLDLLEESLENWDADKFREMLGIDKANTKSFDYDLINNVSEEEIKSLNIPHIVI